VNATLPHHPVPLQVSEEERKMQYEHLFKDVAGVLVDKCVNPGERKKIP
jgi:ribosome maturation protein SDO1